MIFERNDFGDTDIALNRNCSKAFNWISLPVFDCQQFQIYVLIDFNFDFDFMF